MHVIVVANQKGGSGKTTLCRNLAVAAGTDVALIDRDPQGSLTSWWNRRQADTPALITAASPLPDVLNALYEAGMKAVFIDTPPSVNPAIKEILALAHFVLIPVRPTPDDLDAVGPVLELIEASGVGFGFVLSQAKTRTRLALEAVPELAQHGKVAPVVIHDRVDYPTAAIDGRGVTEMADGPASVEVKQLLQYVMTQVRKGRRAAA
jgi:chromosome partitioning protein